MKISQKDLQDFVLFPFHTTHSDMLALESSRHQQSYFQPSSMDNPSMHDPFAPLSLDSYSSFGSHSLLASAPHSFFDTPSFIVEAPPEMNKQALYPSTSPSAATTQSLEHPPSTLSTASGPSLTSASSSAVGSPYSKAAHGVAYQENWVPVSDTLPRDFASQMDPDMIFSQAKIGDTFVGECENVPSSFTPEHGPFFSPISPSVEPFPMSPLSFNRSGGYPNPDTTIDTVLHGAQTPTTPSPMATPSLSYHSGFSSPQISQHGERSPSRFKSPVTPNLSASKKQYMRSPSLPSRHRSRTYPVPASGIKKEHHSPSRPNMSSPGPFPSSLDFAEHTRVGPFQDSFFHQSSGNFVRPLESSYPSLIQPIQNHQNTYPAVSYPDDMRYSGVPSPGFAPVSPAHSHVSYGQGQNEQQQQQTAQAPIPISSPYLTESGFPQRPANFDRRSSISSIRSQRSQQSPQSGSVDLDDEGKEKGRCPHPDCGRVFKDLRAHMLTHQSERPEKCPIVNCEYHFKGFARKYDKNRHTLTHYKGTMVCGFCPGSGSAAEKSFNRADVFKRHLTSVHGVEQTPPNSRKKSPPASSSSGKMISSYCQDATGKCSTCSATFDNAQDFYEHLDDCVLRIVQQEDPSEAINEKRLTEVASDDDVKKTMEKHMLVDTVDMGFANSVDDENCNDENDNDFNESTNAKGNSRSGKGALKSNKPNSAGSRPVIGSSVTKGSSRSATATVGGKMRPAVPKKRGNKNNYPPSWSCPANKMKAKKRVLCVYDGSRRLWKDEMMLDNEFEVRVKLPGVPGNTAGGEAYVTDLDVETLKRAEGVLNATEEEKGPWYGSGLGPQGLIGPAAVGIPPCTSAQEQMDEIDLKELMA